jgi:hypothetical protein
MPPTVRSLFVAALLAAAPALHAQGRPLRADGVRGLTFGTVFPGVQVPVPASDAARSAQFEITGSKNSSIQITLLLPDQLTGAGATIPLTFGATDGGYSLTGFTADLTPFDPRVPFTTALSNNGRVSVFLGGTLVPPNLQRAGSYVGTITITVAPLSL